MTWTHRYRSKILLRSSLWAAPVASMMLAVLAAPLIRMLDDHTRWALLDFGREGSSAAVGALASSLLTFIVFAFSIILLAVQVAGAQLSPLIVGRFFESRIVKLVLSAFVFSFAYSVVTLGRIEDRVPQLPVTVAFVSSLISIVMFLYLIQMASQSLRQGSVIPTIAADTCKEIYAVFPNPHTGGRQDHSGPNLDSARAQKIVAHNSRSGTLVAFHASGLLEIARRAGCTVELVPRVGDFVATGEAIFRLYGASAGLVDDGLLRDCLALGAERSLDDDPAFGFRILVDIAIKALSAAINDPTTGVLAIDHIQRLLHVLSRRQLDPGLARDSSGEVRLVYRTPSWDDFVTLAVTEIRVFGAGSPQVTRRLQAMFEHLLQVVPVERSAALVKELALLRRTIDRSFADPEDRVMAGVGDLQGFGSTAKAAMEYDGIARP